MQDRMNKNMTWRIATIAVALALALAALLAGCSSQPANQGSESSTPNSSDTTETAPQQTSYPLTISLHDGDGTEVSQTYDKAPERVVTLTDSAAEIMCRLGLADKVVGTVKPEAPMPSDIAADYAKIPVMGDKKTLSRETIVGSSPDLIIGRAMTFNKEKQSDPATYNGLGSNLYIQVATSEQGEPNLQGVIDDVKNIAAIFNVQDKAQPLVDKMEGQLKSIKDQVAKQKSDKKPSVLIMTNFKDGAFGTFGGATGASLQFSLIDEMGGTMASTKSASGLTYENLIEMNPDIILYITAERNKATDGSVLDTLYNEPSVQSVPAIANKKVVEIPYAEFMDTTPRIFDSAEKILSTLYPSS